MDLNELLKKTEGKKAAKVKVARVPLRIATEERPYDNLDSKPKSSEESYKKIEKLEKIEKTEKTKKPSASAPSPKNRLEKAAPVKETAKTELVQKPIEIKVEPKKEVLPITETEEVSVAPREKVSPEQKIRPPVVKESYPEIFGPAKRKDTTTFASLSGLERELVIYLHELCVTNRSNQTTPISNAFLSTLFNKPMGTIKTSLRRVEAKTIIKRLEFLSGKGGFTIYELPDRIHQEISAYGKDHVLVTQKQSGNNSVTVREQEQPLLNLKDNEWRSLDLSPLSFIRLGMDHIAQLKNGTLTPEQVQDSINHFAYRLQNPSPKDPKIEKPLNYFMATLKKGIPFARPDGFLSEEDQEQLRYIESLKKVKQEKEEREKELFDLLFNAWIEKLSTDEKKSMIPAAMKTSTHASNLFFRDYYKTNIWPNEKKS